MTRARTKQAELLRFEIFRRRAGVVPAGDVTQPDPPEPDICLTGTGVRIGVELTELVTSRSARAQESEQDGVVAAAKRLYEAKGLPFIGADFYWKDGVLLTKTDRVVLAASLSEIAASHVPDLGTEVILDPTAEATKQFDHPLFDRIWLNRVIEFDENLWDSPRSWWVPQVGPEVVQSRIDAKNSRPAEYQLRYSDRWLVITSDGARPSSGFDLASGIFEKVYKSAFDRVFLAVFAMGGIHELKISPLAA